MFEAVSKSQKVAALEQLSHFKCLVSLWCLQEQVFGCPASKALIRSGKLAALSQQLLTWQVSVEDVERKFWSLCQENDEVEAPSLPIFRPFPVAHRLCAEGGVWK